MTFKLPISTGVFLIVLSLLAASCQEDKVVKTKYHENGNLQMRIEWEDDTINGNVTTYYEDGGIQFEAFYVNGDQHGESKWYNEDGKLICKSNFDHGRLHGKTAYYYDNGDEREFHIMMEGDTIRSKYFDKDGKSTGGFVDFTKAPQDSIKKWERNTGANKK